MMKYIKIISIIFIFCFFVADINVFAEYIKNLPDGNTALSITGDDPAKGIESLIFKLINIVIYIFWGVLLIFVVYAGAQMILSMGTNEEELSRAKRTLWYSILGVAFIWLSTTLYNALRPNNKMTTIGSLDWNKQIDSIFTGRFTDFFVTIIDFLSIILGFIAVLVIVIAGIRIMYSRGKEDIVSEGKNKILWSTIGLIFISFVQVWLNFVFTGSFKEGRGLFVDLINLAIFIAGPVAVFFVTLAGYYYLTANGDEERAKKGKNIIINTLIAIVILIAGILFFNDLKILFN